MSSIDFNMLAREERRRATIASMRHARLAYGAPKKEQFCADPSWWRFDWVDRLIGAWRQRDRRLREAHDVIQALAAMRSFCSRDGDGLWRLKGEHAQSPEFKAGAEAMRRELQSQLDDVLARRGLR